MTERLIIERRVEPDGDTKAHDRATNIINKESPGTVVVFPRSGSIGARYIFPSENVERFSNLVMEHSIRKVVFEK